MFMDIRDKELFNEEELQEFLGVSRTTLWKLRKDSSLPYAKVGREYRYLKSEIIEWLKNSGSKQSQLNLNFNRKIR